MVKIVPGMLFRAVLSFNVPLMAIAADLMLPPLMMLLALLMLGAVVSAIFAFAGGVALPTMIFGWSVIVLINALPLAWVCFGRGTLRPGDLLALPGVFFGKYFAMWRGRGAGWVRTDRK